MSAGGATTHAVLPELRLGWKLLRKCGSDIYFLSVASNILPSSNPDKTSYHWSWQIFLPLRAGHLKNKTQFLCQQDPGQKAQHFCHRVFGRHPDLYGESGPRPTSKPFGGASICSKNMTFSPIERSVVSIRMRSNFFGLHGLRVGITNGG